VEDTLAGKFAALLEKVWSGKYLVLHPADFKNTLAIYHSQFKDFRQASQVIVVVKFEYFCFQWSDVCLLPFAFGFPFTGGLPGVPRNAHQLPERAPE
jgi:hypothetical protein